ADGGEVVDTIPLGDQRQIGQQPVGLRIVQRHADGAGTVEQRRPHAAAPGTSAGRRSKPLKRPFFRCTSSSEIAAGVIPEIRDACPKVSGRCLSSFWRTSKLRAVTCE